MHVFYIIDPQTGQIIPLTDPTQPNHRHHRDRATSILRPSSQCPTSVAELGSRNDRASPNDTPVVGEQRYGNDFIRSATPSPDDEYSEITSDGQSDEEMPDDESDGSYTEEDDSVESDPEEQMAGYWEENFETEQQPSPPRSRSATPSDPEIHLNSISSAGPSEHFPNHASHREPDRYDPETGRQRMRDMLGRMERLRRVISADMDELRHLRDMMTLHLAQAQYFAELGYQ
jgi:hypothetical protein